MNGTRVRERRGRTTISDAVFDVLPGKETEVDVRLKPGGKIGFRLVGSADDVVFGFPWVIYRIVRPENGQPVLEDEGGVYWGGHDGFPRELPADAIRFVPLEPGEYRVETAL